MKKVTATIAYYHYSYESGTYDGNLNKFKVPRSADIGIIAVSEPFTLAPGSAAIAKLPTAPAASVVYFYIHGFGLTGTGGSSSTLLTGLTVTQTACTNIANTGANGVFCTKSPNTNICDGDYGGPVTDDKGVLYGIASVSLGCSLDTSAGHTDVFTYKNWITSMTNGQAS